MTSRLWIDLETFSSVDLFKANVYRYAASPDFKILMAAWSIDGETVHVALTDEEIDAIPGLWDPDVVKVAHNAQFERICLSEFGGRKASPDDYLSPEEWYDTQAIAAEHGWPQSLSNLAKALGGEQKDEAGTRLINLFCKPNRKGERNLPADYPMEWLDFIAYCEQDVYTLIDVDRRLTGWPTAMEHAVFMADQAINDRGIKINVDLAQKAMEAAELNQSEQLARVREIAGIDNPNSTQQMGAWLEREGIAAPNLRAETVSSLLEGELSDDQREVLELRQELALVASKKYASALGSVLSDGRLRGTLKFFGAHTGRWAGRGTQIQNLPRLAFKEEVDTELCIDELLNDERVSAEDLKRLVRPMFTGPFTVVDYSAIEARVIAWLAGEQWAIDAFALGRDIYVETAERMGGLTRSQGKIAVLGLGYAGGVNTLVALGGIPGMDEKGLQNLVVQWRKANPNIVRLWQTLGDGFSELGQVGPRLKVLEEHDSLGRAVKIELPSGRCITYHDVRWERYAVKDPKTGRVIRKESWRFANPKDPFNRNMRIGTYGGSLTENATQAVARDIMAEALVRLENAGYRVVGHVHDEILVEGEHDVEEIKRIMIEPPAWADGLPIDGEGFRCLRYRKG